MEQLSLFHQDKDLNALSEAEKEVAREVARQKSNKQIAHVLGKSISTVESQLKSICGKWHCPSRVGVAIGAIAHGFITLDEAVKAGQILMLALLLPDADFSGIFTA